MAWPTSGLIIQIALVVASLVVVYYLYGFISTSSSTAPTVVVGNQITATAAPPAVSSVPVPYEGGDYTVSFWIYVNSYNVNRNSRKHIISVGGTNFSTIFIALGAFKNNLVVRTHSRDSNAGSYTPTDTYGTRGNSGRPAPAGTTPSSQIVNDGSLTQSDVNTLLAPMALDDSILNKDAICDLKTIDFQRWVQVTVILSGRSIDVYMDGKLSRSCITNSYFKVDPTGVKVSLLSNGGFDGYLSKIQLSNMALNPSDIYNLYTAGP
uniref:Uncharacterized protein n=1 Tax=viral metagenome TaxID=1070528 RepID=A0A6C0JXN8_9ZZZZ